MIHIKHLAMVAMAATLVAPPALSAKKGPKAWIDPAKATAEDPDFLIQGEYAGAIKTENGEEKYGVQVIALGGGKFRAVSYPGGLPGAGFGGDKSTITRYEATKADGKVTFKDAEDNYSGTIEAGKLTVKTPEGQAVGVFPRVERKSPTLGLKPPAGAVVLFDGTEASLANWKKGARMTDDGLLMEGVRSAKTFGDATIHVEFLLPYKPEARGQGRGNSGLYTQGRYETQMLDSFGLEGKHNECGGIYSIKDPDVNMCLPPLTWQTYDIEFTAARFDASGKKTANARMTVKLNGVVVHHDIEAPKSTTASPLKEGPEPGPIYLQNHGNPVRYRNIWFVPK